MLWFRGILFTVLIPGFVAFYLPHAVDPGAHRRGGAWELGWILVAAGTATYFACLLRFLAAGGTPAIFFTRPLRFLIGEEPGSMISSGLYRYSRNPMYLGVLMVVFGQSLLFGSPWLALYGCAVFFCFHLVVVFLEEPHLRTILGAPYEEYCRRVPRWLGPPKS